MNPYSWLHSGSTLSEKRSFSLHTAAEAAVCNGRTNAHGLELFNISGGYLSIWNEPGILVCEGLKWQAWCPGPDLNRHDPLLESQDFKCCYIKINYAKLLNNNEKCRPAGCIVAALLWESTPKSRQSPI